MPLRETEEMPASGSLIRSISAPFLPSYLPHPPSSYPNCQEYIKQTLNARKEILQKDKLEVSGLTAKPLLSCGHLFLIPVETK